jgi:hypothetical protein
VLSTLVFSQTNLKFVESRNRNLSLLINIHSKKKKNEHIRARTANIQISSLKTTTRQRSKQLKRTTYYISKLSSTCTWINEKKRNMIPFFLSSLSLHFTLHCLEELPLVHHRHLYSLNTCWWFRNNHIIKWRRYDITV